MTSATVPSSSHYPVYSFSIPYTSPSGSLQTLDTWLPRPLQQSGTSNTTWIIYVHGGAWRDPQQDSKGVQPTIRHLESSHPGAVKHIAGIASINYRLSPYPSHPTNPNKPDDVQRNAKHPDHVRDVARAIEYLKKEYGMKRWIGVGHSCGATILLQYVSGISFTPLSTMQPEALLVLEGIYSIPLLLQNHQPSSCPEKVSRIYHDFICGAFGDASTYKEVSPVSGSYSVVVWPGAKVVLLGHSAEDELVEVEQRDVMLERLKVEGWSGEEEGGAKRIVLVRDMKGGHDEMWEDGIQIAGSISEVLKIVCSQ
jgi:kynurenine formamidase